MEQGPVVLGTAQTHNKTVAPAPQSSQPGFLIAVVTRRISQGQRGTTPKPRELSCCHREPRLYQHLFTR